MNFVLILFFKLKKIFYFHYYYFFIHYLILSGVLSAEALEESIAFILEAIPQRFEEALEIEFARSAEFCKQTKKEREKE